MTIDLVDVFVDEAGAHGNPLGIAWASPSTRGRERDIVADVGFSETVFIDSVSGRDARARIFGRAGELPFSGHPLVGLAAWLLGSGDDIRSIAVPAGDVRVRADGDLVFVRALPEWAPEFQLEQLDSVEAVEGVDPDAYGRGLHYVWAWIDEGGGRVRARMFAPGLGIREDEATGSAAIRLSAQLARDLDIRQGAGSMLRTHSRYLGQQIEVGGRTSPARTFELG
nr:PhzF family phenazine biosynthesis protein [Microbacterium ulmi]